MCVGETRIAGARIRGALYRVGVGIFGWEMIFRVGGREGWN